MNEGFQNFNNANFDPNSLANQTATAILFSVVTDVSPSITNYVNDMNVAAREVFMDELANCHRKDDILIKNTTFSDDVKHSSGFLPITSLQSDYLDVNPRGHATALYKATLESLEAMIAYRKDLEAQGIEVRSCVFIITDGHDNMDNGSSANKVKQIVDDLRKNEAWASSFTINMLGVGDGGDYEQACRDMGLNPDKCLSKIGATAKEIRAQMGVVSQSVSSSSASTASVNF